MITLSGYYITEILYQGTRTEVYRGIRNSDNQPVIIKVLRNQSPKFNELLQFHNQYILTRHLEHPTIVQPLALERYGNAYALVMPDDGAIALPDYWYRGVKILESDSEQSLSKFLKIAIQLAESLHYLNQKRIIHKDIKPANILINTETKQVQLIDFSIASLLPKEQQELTNPNVLEGTLAYISPEQTGRMNRGIDYRSDFYSLGVTFFELLIGELPFTTDDAMELVHCHIAKMPILESRERGVGSREQGIGNRQQVTGNSGPRNGVSGRQIPQMLIDIVMKLMAKNAEERYQSALGLKHDLEKCLEQWETKGEIAQFELGERDLSDRFLIPEKLYGRGKEVEQLLAAFERVSQAGEEKNFNAEMMLVAGFSGIGKTAVVNEVHKPITHQHGYFIKGKFDQFNRNLPFSAFVQALRDLMEQLLSESDAQLATWRTKILAAVGENGQVLIEVIPELEQVIGKQPTAPELSGMAVQNRFNLLFQKFIEVFTDQTHPLVIFLDDLQWADAASLKLIKVLMEDKSYLLLLGAYRDNEVSPVHPFIVAVEELKQLGKTVNTITLKPLAFPDMNQLVADTLHCATERSEPLTELINRKTKGNPFFTTQFLKGLHEDGYITFNQNQGYWQCDIIQINDLSLTDDVVEFMSQKLLKLPKETQQVLKLAACIGNQFDLETLAIVAEKLKSDVVTALWKALEEGLILVQGKVYKFYISNDETEADFESLENLGYRFLHDRVQQAAYSLIPDHQKQANHYHIGQLLLEQISPEIRERRIFEIVNQLNYGVNLITKQIARDELAELNLVACCKARGGSAYKAAREYAKIGIDLLGSEAWQRKYKTTLQLHELAAEASAISGDIEAIDRWIEAVMENGETFLDKVESYMIKMQALTTQNNLVDAIACGQSILEKLGVKFPNPVTPVELQQEIEEIQTLIGDRSIEDLLHLPVMVNPEKLAILKIAARMIPACYMAGSPLFPLLGSLQTKLSIQYGNGIFSSTGYADYGMFMLHFKKDIPTSNQFGQLAYHLASGAKDKNIPAVTFVPVGLFLHHHQNHLRETVPIIQAGYQAALETGKVEYLGHHSYGFCLNSFWCGQPLKELVVQIRAYLEVTVKFKLSILEKYCLIFWEVTVLLLGNPDNIHLQLEESDDGRPWMTKMLKSHDATQIFHYYLHRGILRFILGNLTLAKADILAAKKYVNGGFATVCEAGFYFYDSLIALATVPEYVSDIGSQLQQVEENQNNLHLWSEYAPMNYLHKWQLVEAEKYRVVGKKYEAGDFYDRAIAGARQNEYVQEEALANELAAKFYLNWGKEKIATGYMQEAYYAYARWGSKAKTEQLEQSYPQLLTPILQQVEPSSSHITTTRSISQTNLVTVSTTTSLLDLTSALKASQALSEEIELDALLSKLMQIIIENAGAGGGALILNNFDSWEIAAYCDRDNCRLLNTPLQQTHTLPKSIINRVKRTRQRILINYFDKENINISDPYFFKQTPQSLCCTPMVNQGKLIGILYLENHLSTGAFTPERIEVLNLLSSKAAISIQNALLYRRLEDYSRNLETQVEIRTQELQENNQQLQSTLQQLQQTQAQLIQTEKMSSLGQMVAGIAHEINNPITFIAGNITHAQQDFQDLIDLIELYKQNFPQSTPAIQDKLAEIDLEFLCNDLPKMLASMKNGSDRIHKIILGLRNFSRLDESESKQVDIHEGLDNTLMILQHRFKGKGNRREIAIVKNYGKLPLVHCYPSQLNQVFLQIITNAIDVLTSAEIADIPEIRITTQTQNDKTVRIFIADNGPGMSEQVRQKIFDPFFTTKPVGQGTGLGLSTSYQIITEQHHGELYCISQLGKGTEFIIDIPIEYITINI
ncbi:trifunctional serine/threonine-protein kinase/ATP-binding protein/sensor histidine kinase [Dapis sp. BLCC M126]|uniref:trifunctional serine/threonine-protein kinase/ATP-binding protein/sensor histidine kinase n=1 Tax=Dapis sp. BLCC M126 TaxID=3400189 RepID=UPI003CED1FAF